MTKFEEEFNYLIELSGKVLLGQVDAETFKKNRIAFFEKYETDQQQALPVVPEDVAEWIEHCKGMGYGLIAALTFKLSSTMHEELSTKILKWLGNEGNDETFALAFITGKYQVEKPQLFYIDLPKVFGLSDSTSDSTFVSKTESGIISEFTKGKDYALKLTEQEIKSIDERYWQFAVPVEGGE
ncbi:DUF1642 domain-containing protein [Lactococcus cremoris]|uniref:DUF1642 domain-containing protein n=1 Tax=Lactococcus lactis subsp. cremoris (strain MG1363) TaxID=416870 RepID=A2RJG2_LACLM|nr:DUF1642 domain-containing protein [Lactococcus cremoris]AAX13208.1 unknown [Lactococcus phage TP712]ADJ59830.1 hypothetical protein LLNZ_04205 [Lactococcus cremoris subsp. cremoris NZ9000]KZK49138.1 hypothetical protein NCDO763_2296 [Lactococcus cremoris]MCT4436665.1 DUF1642 domain-containing protein [Lactococcus cremoris]MCT4446426.1 DUF1642 domain-containing protein [Lactococcus cremoris]